MQQQNKMCNEIEKTNLLRFVFSVIVKSPINFFQIKPDLLFEEFQRMIVYSVNHVKNEIMIFK
ncbi:hypothetical protein DXB55_04190 [Streptococcus anginosus]|nr:hypothetical protein DXB55_04190 [Streptococcus anginosus]